MITVYFILPPRHSKAEIAPDLCRDYGGKLGYEAKLRFRISRAGRRNTGSDKQLWLRQHIKARHYFLDISDSLCEYVTVDAIESFRIDGNGNSSEDHHWQVSSTYGDPCPKPCVQVGYVWSELRVVHLRPVGAGALVEYRNGSSYECAQGTAVTRAPDGAEKRRISLRACPSDPAAEVQDAEELEEMYGTATYSYGYQITHCDARSLDGRDLPRGPFGLPDTPCDAPAPRAGLPGLVPELDIDVGPNGRQSPGGPARGPKKGTIERFPFNYSAIAWQPPVAQRDPVGAALSSHVRRRVGQSVLSDPAILGSRRLSFSTRPGGYHRESDA